MPGILPDRAEEPAGDQRGRALARWAWPARTITVRPWSRTATAPETTRVSVPSQRSTVSHFVPRTVATLLRPCVRKRPPRSEPHRRRTAGLRGGWGAAAAATAGEAAGAGQPAKEPPRRCSSVT